MRQFFTLYFFIFSLSLLAQESTSPLESSDVELQKSWVDSTYNSLSLKEKIGQLYMVQVFSNQDQATKKTILNQITTHHIGGVIYSNGGPVRQAQLNNELQAASKIPLLVGMDAEWGLSMRLDSTYAFPWNMTLGAIKNLDLIRQTGKHIGEHCKRIGVHFNFAPVVDINTNPKNPIIGNRSFGEDKEEVTNVLWRLWKACKVRVCWPMPNIFQGMAIRPPIHIKRCLPLIFRHNASILWNCIL